MSRSTRCGRDWSRGRRIGAGRARALVADESDGRVDVTPALERVGSFAAFLGESFDEAMTYAALRKAESVGRPVGPKEWLADMDAQTGLTLAPAKRGPRPKEV